MRNSISSFIMNVIAIVLCVDFAYMCFYPCIFTIVYVVRNEQINKFIYLFSMNPHDLGRWRKMVMKQHGESTSQKWKMGAPNTTVITHNYKPCNGQENYHDCKMIVGEINFTHTNSQAHAQTQVCHQYLKTFRAAGNKHLINQHITRQWWWSVMIKCCSKRR